VSTQSQCTRLLSQAVQVICEFMFSMGLPSNVVESELRNALEKALLADSAQVPRGLNPLSEMASLLSRWHVQDKYVDRFGYPRPLTWNGKRGTLLGLAREVIGRERAKRVVTTLISRRLVVKNADGSWRPKAQVVRPRGLDRTQVLRTAGMLRRLLQTISHNSERRYRGDDLLFEVMTRVPRLPSRHLPSFKRFARRQGMTYVRSVDDWLESRNLAKARRKRRNVREAGVIVFAFEEPAIDA